MFFVPLDMNLFNFCFLHGIVDVQLRFQDTMLLSSLHPFFQNCGSVVG